MEFSDGFLEPQPPRSEWCRCWRAGVSASPSLISDRASGATESAGSPFGPSSCGNAQIPRRS
jgi:hypothetical protein